jgi:hypothetical protein
MDDGPAVQTGGPIPGSLPIGSQFFHMASDFPQTQTDLSTPYNFVEINMAQFFSQDQTNLFGLDEM